jgi:hypothetical protein
LGVSLVAIAAVAASLTLARHRDEQRQPETTPVPDNAPLPMSSGVSLDAIRSAGL